MNDAAFLLMIALTVMLGLSVLFVLSSLGFPWQRLGKGKWLVLLGLVAIPLTCSFLLEAAGKVVPAELLSKSEEISISSGKEYDGGGGPSWTRNLRYHVSFHTLDQRAPIQMVLRTDSATFDRLPLSGRIEVRYLHWLFVTYARWTQESPWAFVKMYWEHDFLRACLVTGLVIFFCYLLYPSRGTERRRRKSSTAKLIRTIRLWLAITPPFVWISMNLYSQFFHGPAVDSSWNSATAEVRGVASWREEGYSFVELSFKPSGYANEVVAVDTVDSRSIIGLGKGHEVNIFYPLDNPRQARMAKATRSYLALGNLSLLIVGFSVLLGFAILYSWLRDAWKGRKSSVQLHGE